MPVALVTGVAALPLDTCSEKNIEKTDIAAWPSDGYTDLSVKASLGHFSAPANWMSTTILGDGQIEIDKMSLGGLYVQSDAKHSIWEVEVKVSFEVAINVPVWVNVQGVGFFIDLFGHFRHETFSDVPCEGSLCIP